MAMIVIPVHQALETMAETEYDFKIVADGVTLFQSSTVYRQLMQWATWSFIAWEATITQFKDVWEDYLSEHAEDLKKAWDALQQQYDPLSNYDMTETEYDGNAEDESSETVTPKGKTRMETTTDRPGFDSTGDGVQIAKTTADQSYLDDYNVETVHSMDNTLPGGGDLSGSYHSTHDRQLQRAGNIGVTTSQQMAEAELQLRMHHDRLLYEFCAAFISQWCSLI